MLWLYPLHQSNVDLMSQKKELIFLRFSSVLILLILSLNFSILAILSLDIMHMQSNFLEDFEEFHNYSEKAWNSMVPENPQIFKRKAKRGLYEIPFYPEHSPICIPKQGPPGCPGQTGSAGEPGNPGENGQPGLSGFDLYKEPLQCIICPVGPEGPPGTPGLPGELGPPGVPGENSFYVFVGAPGPPGPPGDSGTCGTPGEAGKQGSPGNNFGRVHNHPGPPGLQGPPGTCGKPGVPGSPAINPPGPIGLPGAPGKCGVPGAPGPCGNNGKPGHPGKDADYCSCPIRSDNYPNSPPYKNGLLLADSSKSYEATPAPPPPPPPPHHAPAYDMAHVTGPVYPTFLNRYSTYAGYRRTPVIITSDRYAPTHPQFVLKARRPAGYRTSPYNMPPPPPYIEHPPSSYAVPPPSYSSYYTGDRYEKDKKSPEYNVKKNV